MIKKLLTCVSTCALVMSAAQSAHAATFSPVLLTTTQPGAIEFRYVVAGAPADLVSLEIELTLPDGVFDYPPDDPASRLFTPGSSDPASWETFGTTPSASLPQPFVKLSGGTRDLALTPVSFAVDDTLFSFTLALLNTAPGNEVYSVSFTYLFAGEDLEQIIGEGAGRFATPIPEPSTYALMLGGLLGLGFIARRRSA